jgi:hypothetical protein
VTGQRYAGTPKGVKPARATSCGRIPMPVEKSLPRLPEACYVRPVRGSPPAPDVPVTIIVRPWSRFPRMWPLTCTVAL